MVKTSILNSLLASALVVLAGCGGGGGGGGPVEPPAEGYTLGGTLTVPETSAVDSDSNDPNQAGRKANDSLATAQQLLSPVYLLGAVNEVGKGPDGPNYSVGDDIDLFQVDLKAGQVIELEFSANAAVNDVDLYALAEGSTDFTNVIGSSIGVSSYECLRVERPGRHFIAVVAESGAAIYNMRIGAPGEGGNCDNVVQTAGGMAAGEVVAKPKLSTGTDAQAGEQARSRVLRAGALSVATAPAGVPGLLRLPSDGEERVQALARLAALSPASLGEGTKQLAGPTDTQRTAALSAAKRAARGLPPALQDVIDTVTYAKHLARTGLYEYAEPNYRMTLSALVGPYPPNDRLYANQRWHYEMIGLPAAMNRLVPLTQLQERPIVAVIDSGIVADHPDLQSQIVDAASFTGGNGSFLANADDPSRPGDPTGFHGTHVAGTVAALTFDGNGVAGVAPMAQLRPIRVFAQGADTSSSNDIAQAILYAARLPNVSGRLPARRADVINLSLGGTRSCPAVYADVINQARAAGVIVVAASGNETASANNAPANCPGVISVGAVDAAKKRAFYSNTDPVLSLAAPGGDSRQSTTGTGLPDEVFSTLGDFNGSTRVPSYGGMMGTSMATPHVAGVMAMMRFANPNITVEQIDALLAAGRLTDDLGAAGRDSSFGFGLINADKAVAEALATSGTAPVPVPGTIVAQPSSIDFGALRSTADLTLALQGGASSETVVSVTSSNPAITVTPTAVDAAKLGTYAVAVSRDSLPNGSTFATLRVTTTVRAFDVQISIQKLAPGAVPAADFGRVYVLVLDPATEEPVGQAAANAVNGKYTWSLSGIKLSRVQIVAGTDLDNDNLLCQRGEACGGYPQFGAGLSVLELTGNRNDIDFELSPYGGVSSAAVGGVSEPPRVFRRLATGAAR
jgi:serine protease